MALTEDAVTTTPTDTAANAAAWLVSLVILAGLVGIVVIFAFSNNNTPASIDGTTATTSQFIDE